MKVPEPQVVYEDEGLVALVKPAGLLVHEAAARVHARRTEPTLADWLHRHYPETGAVGDEPVLRPGLVHRLDKDTSGIMLVARRQADFEYLKSLFKERKVHKVYLALSWGRAREDKGLIAQPIGIKSGTTKRSIHSAKMSKPAETSYEVIARATTSEEKGVTTSLFKVMPHTGRTHQIRVHLAAIGHPIVGDPLYGPRRSKLVAPRLMLHAWSLEFERRPGELLALEAEPDEEFVSFLIQCGYPQGNLWASV